MKVSVSAVSKAYDIVGAYNATDGVIYKDTDGDHVIFCGAFVIVFPRHGGVYACSRDYACNENTLAPTGTTITLVQE